MVQEPATSKPISRLSSPGIMYIYLKFIYIYIMYYFRNQPWLGSKCRLSTPCPCRRSCDWRRNERRRWQFCGNRAVRCWKISFTFELMYHIFTSRLPMIFQWTCSQLGSSFHSFHTSIILWSSSWQVEAAVAAASFDQLDTNKDGVITREENLLRSAATDEWWFWMAKCG